MQAARKPSSFTTQSRAAFESNELGGLSPQQSATATSGTYFKAVRSTDAEAAALARGEPIIDSAKVEGLRFELDIGIWRCDAARIAQGVLAEAGPLGDDDDE